MSHELKKSSQIATKNIGLSIIDTFTLGLGSSIKDTLKEIREYSELCNEALYTLQIKTFLESIELKEEEIKKFFEENTNHQRMGLEIFKILETTYLENQAHMIAIIFTSYVKGEIEKNKFNKYINLIKKIDSYLWDVIVEDMQYAARSKESGFTDVELPIDFEDIFSVGNFETVGLSGSNELRVVGFIEDEILETPVTFSGSIKPERKSKRTQFYIDFYFDIFRKLQAI